MFHEQNTFVHCKIVKKPSYVNNIAASCVDVIWGVNPKKLFNSVVGLVDTVI